MNVAITGHTSGIGLLLSQYFKDKNYSVKGFSRSNGYNITSETARLRILSDSKDCEIFINNAYNNFDNSQLDMLKLVCNSWVDTDKLVINISSRWTQDAHEYCETKLLQDQYCNSLIYDKLHVVNLKPGWVDTPRVKFYKGSKLQPKKLCKVMDFILNCRNEIKIQSITFSGH